MVSCAIVNLLERPFVRRDFQEKNNIVENGRLTPKLPRLTQSAKNFTRHFQDANYDKYKWLTGSDELNALFCWNCLLFGQDRNTSWTKTGFTHLGNLSKAATAHESTTGHIQSTLALISFGRTRIDTQLDEQRREQISLHNQKVKQNRELLKRFINVVCFLGKQELGFRGHNESSSSINRGNYVEILNLIAEYDPILRTHLEMSTVFKGVSNHIQNDLIEAVASSLLEEIKSEIKETKFVSVLVDETTDVSTIAQLSIVLRYVYDGKTRERFIGFCDVSKDRTASSISEIIRQFLTEFSCNQKLIAQSYDGAANMAGNMNGVQALIKSTHPEALFIHCHAHVLNLVLSQSMNSLSECKIFFSTLSGIAAFFSRSTKRTKFLEEFLKRRLPHVSPTRWAYSSRLVNVVCEDRSKLCDVFNEMLNNPTEIEQDMLVPARGFLSTLEDFTFCFLLRTFNNIYAFTDILYNILQSKTFDILYCRNKIAETRQNIAAMRGNFEDVYAETVSNVGEPSKRKSLNYRRIYCEIFDNVDSHLDSRFQDYGNLQFLALLSCDKYLSYRKKFPEQAFNNLVHSYGSRFENVRLKNELTVLYCSKEFENKTPYELLKILTSTDMSSCFPQLSCLVSLICTIPVSTASVERSFSALKRIKTYSRNTTAEKRLSNLAVISIESELLEEIKRRETFFEKTVQFFATKERRMDFHYR